jgi:hypothetical protein
LRWLAWHLVVLDQYVVVIEQWAELAPFVVFVNTTVEFNSQCGLIDYQQLSFMANLMRLDATNLGTRIGHHGSCEQTETHQS